jgi:hypothetical protein
MWTTCAYLVETCELTVRSVTCSRKRHYKILKKPIRAGTVKSWRSSSQGARLRAISRAGDRVFGPTRSPQCAVNRLWMTHRFVAASGGTETRQRQLHKKRANRRQSVHDEHTGFTLMPHFDSIEHVRKIHECPGMLDTNRLAAQSFGVHVSAAAARSARATRSDTSCTCT